MITIYSKNKISCLNCNCKLIKKTYNYNFRKNKHYLWRLPKPYVKKCYITRYRQALKKRQMYG